MIRRTMPITSTLYGAISTAISEKTCFSGIIPRATTKHAGTMKVVLPSHHLRTGGSKTNPASVRWFEGIPGGLGSLKISHQWIHAVAALAAKTFFDHQFASSRKQSDGAFLPLPKLSNHHRVRPL